MNKIKQSDSNRNTFPTHIQQSEIVNIGVIMDLSSDASNALVLLLIFLVMGDTLRSSSPPRSTDAGLLNADDLTGPIARAGGDGLL